MFLLQTTASTNVHYKYAYDILDGTVLVVFYSKPTYISGVQPTSEQVIVCFAEMMSWLPPQLLQSTVNTSSLIRWAIRDVVLCLLCLRVCLRVSALLVFISLMCGVVCAYCCSCWDFMCDISLEWCLYLPCPRLLTRLASDWYAVRCHCLLCWCLYTRSAIIRRLLNNWRWVLLFVPSVCVHMYVCWARIVVVMCLNDCPRDIHSVVLCCVVLCCVVLWDGCLQSQHKPISPEAIVVGQL